MADKNISTLTAGTVPDGTEKVHVVQGANSRRLVTQDLANLGSALKTEAGTSVTGVALDKGKWIRFTAATAVTWTINTGIHAAGDEITIEQAGAGVVTVTAGASVTINSRGSLIATNGQYAVASLKCISTGVFTLVGDLV